MATAALPLLDPSANTDLLTIRAAHVQRVNEAADRKMRRADGPHAMPYKLQDVGCYLAAAGLTDEPCEGERYFGIDFSYYRALAASQAWDEMAAAATDFMSDRFAKASAKFRLLNGGR